MGYEPVGFRFFCQVDCFLVDSLKITFLFKNHLLFVFSKRKSFCCDLGFVTSEFR